MAHTELNLHERRAIEDMLNAKISVDRIAAEIGRHRATVYREIKRNFFSDGELPYLSGYYGMTAQRSAADRCARRCKLVRQIELRKAVIAELKEGWSPEQIAGRLGFEGRAVRVSHETIYAYIYGPDGQSKELARHLPSRRKKRQPRYARRPRGQVFPPDRSIHQRPEHVKARDAFGDWEGDLMIFERATGKMNVASLVGRKTRFAVLFRNNDRSSTHFMSKLMGVMEALPQGSAIADEAIKRIAQLYAIEKEARGSPPDRRVEIRQAKAKPIFDELEIWLHGQLPSISGKSPLAVAIRYALTRMKRLRPYLDHGILELDNNTAERAMRSVAVGRKNYLFVGSQTGGRAAAIAYTLIETAKLNGVDPQGWLADTLACIPCPATFGTGPVAT